MVFYANLVLLQGSVVEGGGLPTKGRLRSSVQVTSESFCQVCSLPHTCLMTEKPRETQAESHVVELKEKVNNSSLMKHRSKVTWRC